MRFRNVAVIAAAVALTLVVTFQVFASGGPKGDANETERWPACVTIMLDGDGPEVTSEVLAESGAATAVVTVSEVGAATWTTPDGKRPTFDEYRTSHPQIVRPISVDVEDALVGNFERGRTTWALLGGDVGCDSMVGSSWLEPKAGRYVVVGVPSLDKAHGELLLTNMWPVSGDTVQAEFGDISLNQLRADLETANR